eukprot:481459_1
MCTKQDSIKWILLNSFTRRGSLIVPTGMDRNNYIIIDYAYWQGKMNCIRKYDIDNDKWIKIDGFNNMENIPPYFSAALDVKKQILFLSRHGCVTQIQLNNNNISNHNYNNKRDDYLQSSSIAVNNSLFTIGAIHHSIFKWDLENKTFTKFSDMYNKMRFGSFSMIYNHKHNCLLFFGGCDYDFDTHE